jgi:hypothetical protein
MMRIVATSVAVAGALGLAGCAVAPPPGPSFTAMPGNGKTYEAFQADNARCMQIAQQTAGPMSPGQAATQSAVGSAAVGTVLGAAGGALLGAAAGNAGAGAAIGAGAGLLTGSAVGAGNAQASAAGIQHAYDVAYAPCMSAAGNTVQGMSGAPYPASAYPAPGAYPAYGYAYPAPYYGYYGPPVAVGFGWGGGWGGWHGGWGGGYWHH